MPLSGNAWRQQLEQVQLFCFCVSEVLFHLNLTENVGNFPLGAEQYCSGQKRSKLFIDNSNRFFLKENGWKRGC
jgi:hypothetical protein